MLTRQEHWECVDQRLAGSQAGWWRPHDVEGDHAVQFGPGTQVMLEVLKGYHACQPPRIVHHWKKVVGVRQEAVGQFTESRPLVYRRHWLPHEVTHRLQCRRAQSRVLPVQIEPASAQRLGVHTIAMEPP